MGSCVCRRNLRFLSVNLDDIKAISKTLSYVNITIPNFLKCIGCHGIHTSIPNAYIVRKKSYVRQVERKGEPVYARMRSYGMEYDNIDMMVAMIVMAQKWRLNSCKENVCKPNPKATTSHFSCPMRVFRFETRRIGFIKRNNSFSDV